MKTTKFLKIGTLGLLLFGYACNQTAKEKVVEETPIIEETAPVEEEKPKEITYDVNQPETIIQAIGEASGGWNTVWDLKDVEYAYNYEYPDGKKDVSLERYIFDGEHSWGKYSLHEINVTPAGKEIIIQKFGDGKTSASIDGKEITDEKALGATTFLREVNYYWFLMNFKIGDPGTIYKYLGQEEVDGKKYDKVSVAYDAEKTGKEANDSYILYVNPETKLVDQFYFSLPAWKINDPVLLMKVEYTEIDGVQVSTTRYAYLPDGKTGEYPETPSITQKTTNVKFNNGFKAEDLKI